MEWFELDWKLMDTQLVSHSLDGPTRDKNLRDLFDVMRRKVNEVDTNRQLAANSMDTLRTYVDSLNYENAMLKKLVAKMIVKDYPELVLEMPEFIANTLPKEPQKEEI